MHFSMAIDKVAKEFASEYDKGFTSVKHNGVLEQVQENNHSFQFIFLSYSTCYGCLVLFFGFFCPLLFWGVGGGRGREGDDMYEEK